MQSDMSKVREAIEEAVEQEFRQTGYTAAALNYPLTEAGFFSLCKYNGVQPEKAPRTWRFAPNAEMQRIRNAVGSTPPTT